VPAESDQRQEIGERLADNTEAIKALLRSSNDSDVRVLAACALVAISPDDNVTARIALLREIGPESPAMHTAYAWGAATGLGALGSAAEAAIPVLRECLDLDTGDGLGRSLRLSAAESVWLISGDSEPALQIATEMLADEEDHLRCDAAELLGSLGPLAQPAVSDLRNLLGDTEEWVRRQAAEALAKINGS
jgi:HEAT repeat protein